MNGMALVSSQCTLKTVTMIVIGSSYSLCSIGNAGSYLRSMYSEARNEANSFRRCVAGRNREDRKPLQRDHILIKNRHRLSVSHFTTDDVCYKIGARTSCSRFVCSMLEHWEGMGTPQRRALISLQPVSCQGCT
jgi:hypothetical protein